MRLAIYGVCCWLLTNTFPFSWSQQRLKLRRKCYQLTSKIKIIQTSDQKVLNYYLKENPLYIELFHELIM